MDKDQQELKQFLEYQVEWCKKQDSILKGIESKLYKMKELAVYASHQQLTSAEIEELNNQLSNLKEEIIYLEKKLNSLIH